MINRSSDFRSSRVPHTWWRYESESSSVHVYSDGDPTCLVPSGTASLKKCYDVIHESDRDNLTQAFEQCREGKNPVLNIEIRIQIDGKIFHRVTVSGILQFSENGEIISGNGILLNDSYFDQMQSQWDFQAVLLKKIADNLPVALWAKDCRNDDRYIIWNKGAEDLSGFSADQVLGRNDLEIFPEDIAQAHLRSDKEAISSGGLTEEPLLFKPASSPESTRVNQIVKKVIYNDENQPEILIGIAEDITETLEIEKTLLTAKEDAEKSRRVISDFVSTMSHEIRTPLNAVLGFTKLLCNKDDLGASDKAQFRTIIEKNAKHLLKLVNDIFDLTLVESGELALEKKEIRVSDFIMDLYKEFNADWSKPSVAFQLCADNQDAVLFVDGNRLRQVLKHLIGNSLKFTHTGYIQLGYSLDTQGLIRFFVRDSGIGIPRDKQEQVFELFRQGEEGFTRRFGGAGIGLSLSRELVKNLGGELCMETKPEHGSTFYFFLPRHDKSVT